MLLSGNPEPIAVPTDGGRPHEIHRCPSCKVAVWSVYGGISKLRFVRVGTLDGSADAGRPYLCSLLDGLSPYLVIALRKTESR
jgi:hypothetical protein